MSNCLRKKRKEKNISNITYFHPRYRIDLRALYQRKTVEISYKDMKVIMEMVLHDKFGFGGKRLERFNLAINRYTLLAIEDERLKGTTLAYLLNDKYGIDVQAEVDKIPFEEISRLYYFSKIGSTKAEIYNLVNASFFNIFAVTGVILKTKFKMSANQVRKYYAECIELFGIFSNKPQYSLDGVELATTLALETKFYDTEFIKAE